MYPVADTTLREAEILASADNTYPYLLFPGRQARTVVGTEGMIPKEWSSFNSNSVGILYGK